ncbi:MAG: hypothetical protein WBB97_04880, partial [Dehalococcoidales bacterium]
MTLNGSTLTINRPSGWKGWINTVQCMDCLEGMRQMPDGCVDLVVTDPPFTFGLGSSISNTKLDNWHDLLNGSHFYKLVFEECKRIC